MSRVTVAVDLAKTVFQVVVAGESGKIVERRRLTRAQFERFWENRASCRVLMEACGSAHYWGRWLIERGFDVTLLPAHSVTPYVQRNKTDERDAEGLLEAVRSPRVHPVAVKSRDQQQIQALHRIREQWKRTRTARINGMRGLLREFGLICSVGAEKLMKALPVILQEHPADVPPQVRTLLWQMHEEVRELEERIGEIEQALEAIARENEIIQALREIPGVGLLSATALYAAVGNIQSFRSGRHLASWLGLTPRERSSGTKRRLGRISKQGGGRLPPHAVDSRRPLRAARRPAEAESRAADQLPASVGAQACLVGACEQGCGGAGQQAGASDLGSMEEAEPLR